MVFLFLSTSRPSDGKKNSTPCLTSNKKNTFFKKRNGSTHVEKEDLEAFLTSPGAADEAMSLLDVDGDRR